jgi:long-chain acyl-CoA synthetase
MSFILRKTITETFHARMQATPDLVGYRYKPNRSSGWKDVTFREFYDQSRLISFGLMGHGVQPKDRVAILSSTRIEWSLSDMAILGAKAVTIPIYPSTVAEDVTFMLNHSEAKAVVVENDIQLEKILSQRAEKPGCLPFLKNIFVIEPSAMRLAVNPKQNIQDVSTLDSLVEIGKREELKRATAFEDNLLGATPDDWITICYTTGTTGTPKGVPLTHGNLMNVYEDVLDRMRDWVRPETEVLLSFLPCSHVLGKLESMIGHVVGSRQVFAESIEKLLPNLKEVRPTVLISVPRIFEKAYEKIEGTVQRSSPAGRQLFHWAESIGRGYYGSIRAGKTPSIAQSAMYGAAKNLAFKRVSDSLGGRLRFAICGGAALRKDIGEFFEIAGIKILEGYGLTETCAPVTLNDPDHPHFGTVGKPLSEVNLKIAADGEILIKSRKVFHGYHKSPEETAQALRDGWFYTGDIGFLDDEGYLHVTDRKKDLIKTSGGKYVAPQKIEKVAKTFPQIAEIVVYGDQKKYITALLTLNRDYVLAYASEHQILFSEYAELIKHPKVVAWVEKTINEVNKQLASFETIKKFMILPIEFTIEGGELTPSLKVRRKVIQERYRSELDRLYS